MVRLFRGDGNFEDSINGQHVSALEGSGQTFTTSTLPTGAQPRQVMRFDNRGELLGSGVGLPEGDAARTIVGWILWDGNTFLNGPFGYGGGSAANAYYLTTPPVSGGRSVILDHASGPTTAEGCNPIIDLLSANTWYHVAVSYDPVGNVNRSYLNGSLRLSGQPSTRPDTQLTYVSIGGAPSLISEGGYSFWVGYVADFAIFDRALTDAEVASIYNAPEGLTPPCGANSDCTPNYCGADGICTDGSNGSSCLDAQSCTSTFCAGSTPVCTNGQIGTVCDTGENDCDSGLECDSSSNTCKASRGTACSALNECISGSNCLSTNICSEGTNGSACDTSDDCTSGICFGGTCSSGANGSLCGSGSDCTSGYCSPTSNSCATRPILDPCHGISCSNHGKCKGNGVCQCEDTFVQTNNGKDCGCPDGSFLNASVNRCYAPTAPLTSSPTYMPVTSSPTLLVTPAPTSSPTRTFETPDCKDDSSYKFELKRVPKEVGCSWISKNKRRIEKRRSKYCTEDFEDGTLISACKRSCNLC